MEISGAERPVVSMTLEPVGWLRSCFGGKFGAPRQPGLCPSAWGRLVLDPKFRSDEAVRGLDGYSHLWLIFGFHETVRQGWRPTVRPPRLGGNMRIGVFASRSNFRPNGLGLSLVRLEAIDRNRHESPVLLLGGVDLIDWTPVYDIKPYLAYAESVPDADCGFARSAPAVLGVEVQPEAEASFRQLPARSQSLIREAMALDPRPAAGAGGDGRVFGAGLCGCNIRFTIGAGVCRITEIVPAAGSGLYD